MWVGEKLDMKSAACPFSSESLLYAGLHKKQCGQQGEGEDSVPLLCSWETPRAVLHPAFGLPAGKDKDLLKEHNEDDEWPEEPPLREMRLFCLEKKRLQLRFYCGFSKYIFLHRSYIIISYKKGFYLGLQ